MTQHYIISIVNYNILIVLWYIFQFENLILAFNIIIKIYDYFQYESRRICVKKQLVKDKSIMHINNYIKNEIILLSYKSVSDVHGACKNIDCRLL